MSLRSYLLLEAILLPIIVNGITSAPSTLHGAASLCNRNKSEKGNRVSPKILMIELRRGLQHRVISFIALYRWSFLTCGIFIYLFTATDHIVDVISILILNEKTLAFLVGTYL